MKTAFDKWWKDNRASITDPTGSTTLDEALRMSWDGALRHAAGICEDRRQARLRNEFGTVYEAERAMEAYDCAAAILSQSAEREGVGE